MSLNLIGTIEPFLEKCPWTPEKFPWIRQLFHFFSTFAQQCAREQWNVPVNHKERWKRQKSFRERIHLPLNFRKIVPLNAFYVILNFFENISVHEHFWYPLVEGTVAVSDFWAHISEVVPPQTYLTPNYNQMQDITIKLWALSCKLWTKILGYFWNSEPFADMHP